MRNVSASKAALPHTPLHLTVLLKEGFKAHPWTIRFCIQDELLLRDAWAHRGERVIDDAFEIDFNAIRRRAARFAEIVSSARDGDDWALRLLGEFSPLFSRIGFPSDLIRNLQRWFAKALLRDERRIIDYREMLVGHTGVHGDRIVSRSVLVSRRAQLIRQRKFIEQAEVTTKTAGGETLRIPFADVCNTAEKRFAKSYVRLKGLEQHCVERKLAGFFVTLTLPPHFYPNPSVGGSSWDGTTPSEGHAELQRRWRSFHRRFGKVWGVRVEEQHKDGCVHWHALMFMPPEREDEFVAKIEKYFGAAPATDVKRHDPAVAACATYFAKYMMKTTATSQLSGEDANICERADAHRATWGGRCMQFFDVPGSGTVWDELRRVKDPAVRLAELSPEIHALHDSACSNEYARFLTIFAPMRAARRIGIVYGKRRGSTYLRGLAIDEILSDTHAVEWLLRAGAAPASRDAAVASRTLRHSYPSRAKDKSSSCNGGTPARPKRKVGCTSNVDSARSALSMRRGFEGMQSPRLTTFARMCSELPFANEGCRRRREQLMYILRISKLKTVGAVASSCAHTFRDRETPNADPARSHRNAFVGAASTNAVLAAMRARLPAKRRKDAVLCLEYLVTASPEFFAAKKSTSDYFARALKWLREKHGEQNVVCAGIHRDETTPHMVAYVLPLTPDLRLCAKDFVGGPQKLTKMQTAYFSSSWTPFQADRGRDFSVIVDGVSV